MIGLEGDWVLIVTVIAGLSSAGAIALTVVIARHYHRAWRRLAAADGFEGMEEALRERCASLQATERRIAELNDEIAWLEKVRAETSVWHLRLSEVRQRVGALDQHIDELEVIKADIVRCREEQLRAQQELAVQRAANDEFERQGRALADETSKTQVRLNQDRQTLAQLAHEIAAAQRRCGELRAVDPENGRVADSEEVKALRRELEDVRAELARNNDELADVQQEIAAAETRRTGAAEDLREQERRREALTAEILDAELTLKSDREELAQCNEELASARRSVEAGRAEIREDLRELQQRREALTEEITELEHGLGRKRGDLRQGREHPAAVADSGEAARAEAGALHEEHRLRLEQVSAEIAATERRHAQAVAAAREAELRRHAAAEDAAALERDLEAARADLARHRDELAQVRQDLERGRAEMAASRPEATASSAKAGPEASEGAPSSPPPEVVRNAEKRAVAPSVRAKTPPRPPASLQPPQDTTGATARRPAARRPAPSALDVLRGTLRAVDKQVSELAGRVIDAGIPRPAPRASSAAQSQPPSPPAKTAEPPSRRPNPAAKSPPSSRQGQTGAGAGLDLLRGTFRAVDSALSTYLFPKPAPKKRPGAMGKPVQKK